MAFGKKIVERLGLPRHLTLDAAVNRAAVEFGEDIGWVFADERVSFTDMQSRVDRCVAALLAHGIQEGDRIALWLPNLPHWPVCLFACARIGAILVALNTRWKSSEAAYVLEHSRPRLLIMQRRFLKLDYATYLQDIELLSPGAVSGVEQIIDAAAGTADGGLAGASSWDSFLAKADTLSETGPVSLPDADPSRPVLLQYTSGSTARPKGALISHLQILNYGVEYLIRLGVQRGDAYLNTQPLYHVGGSCGAMPVPLTLGCRVVMPHYYAARPVLELIQRERCVARSGAVTMYLDEMALPDFRDFDLTSLRAGWTGASPAVIERIRSEYPIEGMVNLYGATEGGSTSGAIDEPWEKRRDTVGTPLTGTEFRIRNVDGGGWCEAGEVGEICFRGWDQMVGYYQDPERTAEAFLPDGFVRIGDLGRIDDDGFLHYVGRIKDMIRPGGENVAAEEVEAYLSNHPAVAFVAVIAVPDERLGEVVGAVIQLTSPSAVGADAIIEFCKAGMANFRVPKHVWFMEMLPRNDNGKILKAEIRRMLTLQPDGLSIKVKDPL